MKNYKIEVMPAMFEVIIESGCYSDHSCESLFICADNKEQARFLIKKYFKESKDYGEYFLFEDPKEIYSFGENLEIDDVFFDYSGHRISIEQAKRICFKKI